MAVPFFCFYISGSNLITAANFCMNGKFAVVGTYDGRCIFYETEVRATILVESVQLWIFYVYVPYVRYVLHIVINQAKLWFRCMVSNEE